MRAAHVISLAVFLAFVGWPFASSADGLSTWTLDRVPAVLFVTPEGNGNTLADTGAVLHVTFIDPLGTPIALHPVECIVLTYVGSSGYLLSDLPADHDTDASGTTQFSGGVAGGGGWSQEGFYLYATGCTLPWAEVVGTIPIHFNSPDIDGSGAVDLTDIGIFAADFGAGYHFRSDFVHDSRLDLADVGRFALHLGERRP